MKESRKMSVAILVTAIMSVLVYAGVSYCQQTAPSNPAANQQTVQQPVGVQSKGISTFLGYGGAPTGSCCQAGQCLGQGGKVCPLGGAGGCCQGPQAQGANQQGAGCCVQPKQGE